MTALDQLLEKTGDAYLRNGLRGAIGEAAYRLYKTAWCLSPHVVEYGENVYDRDWDALILLDTCRPDALRTTQSPVLSDADVETMTSVGSSSVEWLENTFTEEYRSEIENTAYVTANPNSDVVAGQPFADLDPVWKYNTIDNGSVHPAVLTERAIDVARTTDADRLIIHYMQPHLPFRADMFPDEAEIPVYADLSNDTDGFRNAYDKLREGTVSRGDVWGAYMDNLVWVMDWVEVLLSNVDADPAVISADHTELFGEHGLYCHPGYCAAPTLRKVPWVEVTGSDTESLNPEIERPDEHQSADQDAQLEALGYL